MLEKKNTKMESAYIFKKDGEYLGKISKDEDISKNDLVKTLIEERISILRHEDDLLVEEEIGPGNENYFWAVVEELRKRNFEVYIFEGKRREVAELLANAHLENAERVEFFASLLSVPASELEALKKGIKEDLAILN